VSNVFNLTDFATERHFAGLFADPAAHAHAVQFYEEESFLVDTVGHFIAAGLKSDDRVVVVASKNHKAAFLHRVGPAAERAIGEGQLTLLDAEETLSLFMIGGMPDKDLFRGFVARLTTTAKGERNKGRVRAYGEMVDLLWQQGHSTAAIRLEELWSEATQQYPLTLLCAYSMGNFYREGDSERFLQVCSNHSHVVPSERFGRIDDPEARLREISLLQQRACALESEIRHRKELEGALRNALRECTKVEEELRASATREKEARLRAEASDAFKEIFIGIVGRDLRNPLNTILTTARLLSTRPNGQPEGRAKKVARVVASGIRMQRMIDQLLDMTRARLTDGIPVTLPAEGIDLAALVAKVVDDVRGANPRCKIEVRVGGDCNIRVDADRLEQVVSNLVGNAVTHGDATPIRVVLTPCPTAISITVQNYGRPIPSEVVPLLFNPFGQVEKPEGSSAGLGLGLYISERIVDAHRGQLAVYSSLEAGTTFEVILPR
jgi:signal transduction histidine kinase